MYLLKGENKEMLDKLSDAIIVTLPGFDAICIDCNKNYSKLVGYSREELLNKSMHHLIRDGEVQAVFTRYSSLEKTMATWDDIVLVKKNNMLIPVSTMIFPLFDEQNNLFAYYHMVKNNDSDNFGQKNSSTSTVLKYLGKAAKYAWDNRGNHD